MADEAKGKAKHLGGRIKENVGDLLGDREMEREGRLAQREGEAEQDAERAREDLEDATEREIAARRARKDSKSR